MKIIKDNSNFKDYECHCNWPNDCFVQGGSNGVVLSKNGNYFTSYFEAFPKNPDCFIRGEGNNLKEAEQEAYDKFIKYSNCEHTFEKVSSYRNGMGKCKKCGMMKVVFEPDYTCIICGKHECYTSILSKYKKSPNDCLCEKCASKKESFVFMDDNYIQMACNMKNGLFFTTPVMDEKTFLLLKEKPENQETFFKILENDSNQYLLERVKRLINPDGSDNFIPTINNYDELYKYFYDNYMDKWIKNDYKFNK